MSSQPHILVTGGAGYIGSFLTGELLRQGYRVTVVDELLFGGESLLSYLSHPNFHFFQADVWEPRAIRAAIGGDWPTPDAVLHLAALAGFPACQAVGRQVAWRYNVEATQHVYEQSLKLGIPRFIYVSTYSNYGLSENGEPVTEATFLNPQSLYAETKVASERYLLEQKDASCTPLIFRLATVYGLAPRPRFDMIINQFVWEAFRNHKLVIYQRGYSRSFVHIQDAAQGIMLGLQAPEEKIRGEIYNLGTPNGNLTKDEIVKLILKRLPKTLVRYKDITFGGDMRDLTVSFEKIQRQLGFKTQKTVDDGVREILEAIQQGVIKNPADER
ncbi:MAG: NAD(P)-dependent oxidoreductase, partial [Chloroflexota bacterium]|nr:NAD(P)-dependent oxidoreductase [Chloroflexota bacterium]